MDKTAYVERRLPIVPFSAQLEPFSCNRTPEEQSLTEESLVPRRCSSSAISLSPCSRQLNLSRFVREPSNMPRVNPSMFSLATAGHPFHLLPFQLSLSHFVLENDPTYPEYSHDVTQIEPPPELAKGPARRPPRAASRAIPMRTNEHM